MTRVIVLLSTWNGMRFLPEQIESLFAQDFTGELSLLVRDDGSSDGTIEFLESLDDKRITLIRGTNIGPRRSYIELLRLAKRTEGDYFALCDQDDFWFRDKISRAISLIPSETPALYASSLNIVDEDLKLVGRYRHPGDNSFPFTLLSNYVTGCTCVINRAYLRWMPLPNNADRIIMHDWWLASVATIGAKIVYDDRSHISYRQHSSNFIGISKGLSGYIARVRRIVFRESGIARQNHARELLGSAGALMTDRQRETISSFISARHSVLRRACFIWNHRVNITFVSAVRFLIFG